MPGVRPQPDGSVNVDGGVPIRDLNRAMDWNLPDDEATTVAGLVIHEARSIPERGPDLHLSWLPVPGAAAGAESYHRVAHYSAAAQGAGRGRLKSGRHEVTGGRSEQLPIGAGAIRRRRSNAQICEFARRLHVRGSCSVASPALAQDFPSKAVKVIVPFPPGGPVDVLARALGEAFRERTGQSLIVDNKPGAATALGAAACKHADPDGYTFCLLTASTISLNPFPLRQS